jgi:hypothetical protein
MGFNVGDHVQWQNQTRGVLWKKAGQVLAIVPAGENPRIVLRKLKIDISQYRLIFEGMSRDHESYLVVVDPGKNLHWPRANTLR